jgi:hypothetical protein
LLLTEKTLPVNPVFLNKLITGLENHHKQLTAKIFKKQQADQYLAGILAAEIKATADTPMFLCDFHDLASGLKKTYGRGKKCLDLVIQHPTTENLHELRKIVKSLWNQLILIRPIWPSYISLTVHHLDVLAQRLGLEHDLAELEQYFRFGRTGKDESQVVVLLDFIARTRQRIQRAIRPLAMRLYAEKPAMMAEKMEVFYRLFVG